MMNNQQTVNERNKIKYIYELPEHVRITLCFVLNSNDEWEWLHGLFYDGEKGRTRYGIEQIKGVSRFSPSAEFLKLLSERNFTIEILYVALASFGLKRAMDLLVEYVSDDLKNSVIFTPEEENFSFENSGANTYEVMETFVDPCLSSQMQVTSSNSTLSVTTDSSQPLNNSVQPAYFPRGDICLPIESVVSYSQLIQATNNWSSESCLNSDRKVSFYHARLNEREVAIKNLGIQQGIEALEEIRKLRCASTGCEYILKILMLVEGNGNPCLVYPFMRNGSLYDHINKIPVEGTDALPYLTPENLVDIALGIAKALSYLHFNVFKSAVLVKSSDILLGEAMIPLVADACLPCMVNKPSKNLSLYIPQEISEKENLDLSCLGTIVMELAIGQTADKLPVHPQIWFKNNSSKIDQEPIQALIFMCFGCFPGDIAQLISGWDCLFLVKKTSSGSSQMNEIEL